MSESMMTLGLKAGQMRWNGMSPEFRDELLSIEKRQSKILLNINHLEKHTSFEHDVLEEQKSANSPGSGQPSHAASPVVSGGTFEGLFRWGHSACSKNESHLIVFGGYGGSQSHARLNDILELNVEEGCVRSLRASGGTPSPMMAHTASMVAYNMVIIGGRRSPTCILNTVIILKLKSLEWNLPQIIGAEFPPRHRHAAAVVGTKIYVHGGLSGMGILGDLHILDTSSWSWSEALCEGKLPSPRFSHSLVAIGSKLYLFGGRGRNEVYGDFHILDLETLVWSEAEVEGNPPSPRYSHTMTAVNHFLLVIGGCPITTQGSDLVFCDLAQMSWVRCPISWPLNSLLVRHSATVVGESLVLVGGGAACFAFGTSFSPTFIVNLEPFLHHLTYPENKNLPEIRSEELFTERCGIGKQEIASWVLKVDKDKAKVAKDSLKEVNWLDQSKKPRVIDQDNHVAFPILDVAVSILLKSATVEQIHPKSPAIKCRIDVAVGKLRECGSEVLKLEMPPVSKQNSSPQDSLQKHISSLLEKNGLALSLLEELPKRWERLGDMVVLPAGSLCSSVWSSLGEDLWKTIAFSLSASRLARQAPIASTGTRDSQLQLLCGLDGWVQHRENGILYCFDALKCMFSSGNVSEKLRVAKMQQCQGATVVDLFAGIGYYVLPFLLKAGARKVYACEWNPHAVFALRHNLAVNGVEAMCEVIEGDNRITAPQGVADIVSLGLLPTSQESWPVAVRALKPEGGILLVHENVKDADEKDWINYLLKSISSLAASLGRTWHVSIVHFERVKWYAPHIRHVVADIYCTEALDVP